MLSVMRCEVGYPDLLLACGVSGDLEDINSEFGLLRKIPRNHPRWIAIFIALQNHRDFVGFKS